MQTVISPIPKSWVIEEYEECEQLTEQMKQRMTDYYLSLHGIKEETKYHYLSKIKLFGIFLTKHGIMAFEDANRQDIDLFLSKYNNENTKNLFIHTFRSFYNFIKRPDVIEHLKLYNIEIEQITPSEILSPEEVIAITQ